MKSLFYLKNSFSSDFLEEKMLGNHYFSHILIKKLPKFFRKYFFRALSHTYPSLEEIFDSYSYVHRVMELTKFKTSSAKGYKCKWG